MELICENLKGDEYFECLYKQIEAKDKRIKELEALSECSDACVHYDKPASVRFGYCGRCKRNSADNFRPKDTQCKN